uniref:Uncharacterized protein n=1 Tax=Pristionchus pacificus TaxID=54126 RepID=A0A2A6BLL3_PRIPA|eukprot:PDM66804.1 hypothetical protein PRIPAC_48221 [Pristionchus pacificus]
MSMYHSICTIYCRLCGCPWKSENVDSYTLLLVIQWMSKGGNGKVDESVEQKTLQIPSHLFVL